MTPILSATVKKIFKVSLNLICSVFVMELHKFLIQPMSVAEKRAAQLAATKTTMSYTTAIMTSSRASKTVTTTPTASQSFAAKLTAETTVSIAPLPTTPQLSPAAPTPVVVSPPAKATTPQPPPPPPTPPLPTSTAAPVSTTLEYSLFNDTFTKVRDKEKLTLETR